MRDDGQEVGFGMKMSQKEVWAARADQLEVWANAADTKAAAIYASRPGYASDPAFMTQPARSNHGVARARERINARERTAWQLEEKAKEHRAKAASLRVMAGRNAGDAERQREVRREAVSAAVAAGDNVTCIYGIRRVIKVNSKTFRLEGAFGPLTVDKSLCRKVLA